ncbi:MAG: hypothetical protein ACR652_26205 [Methylocystis sp.]|uniref:hypothetical protein n=1 Tax=Methylocystis sp. TaxID=1911079 RepID=UPI003DA540EC
MRAPPERTIFVAGVQCAPTAVDCPSRALPWRDYFRDHGGHALVVIDDLTKHPATHRERALLARKPPGREAYPRLTPLRRKPAPGCRCRRARKTMDCVRSPSFSVNRATDACDSTAGQ